MGTTTVIIGAGIVGLHAAQVLCEKGHEVYVLDQAPYLADHTSGRNSGVIHAGIFYQSGSLKESVCIEGNRLTYEWLKKLQVAHEPCGKWVVPEPGQEDQLEPFYEKLRQLPIPEPKLFSSAEVLKLEPQLRPLPAIEVPSTGILDAAAYVKAMAVHLENQGVQIILNCKVQEIGERVLETTRGEIPYELGINAAGLWCEQIAEWAGLAGFEIRPCRGGLLSI